MLEGRAEKLFTEDYIERLRGEVQLIFTSPPFPLANAKEYGNFTGQKYIDWIGSFGPPFADLLTEDGSVVIEVGNAWEKGRPVMSLAPTKALMKLTEEGGFFLCQEFIWDNPARLPSPAQWVNIERIRVKDSFTRIWWLSKTEKPKADNRRVLVEYSKSMKKLLERGEYHSGSRPSEHTIGEESFCRDNGGAIPPSVLRISNTRSNDPYLSYCAEYDIKPHPARMPREIPEFFIKFLTDPGDLVLDPFGGSNVTGAVAETLRRQWISFEMDELYIEGSMGRFDEVVYLR